MTKMLAVVLLCFGIAVAQDVPPIPSALFGRLFVDVQQEQVYGDQKTFCDAISLEEPAAIMAAYANNTLPLAVFVGRFFVTSTSPPVSPPVNQTVPQRIEWLWPYLTKRTVVSNSSLIALPRSYVVPGSRFSESFYWDSYFISLGLPQAAVKQDMIDNFAALIDRFGFVANGNRNYFLSRSQPPFFSLMIRDFSARSPMSYAAQLLKEYSFWMGPNKTVQMPDGSVLNRYWDELDIPRDESYLEDVTTCKQCRGGENCGPLYRDLRSAAESGWDFSSRWLGDRNATQGGTTANVTLCSIRTTSIVPVDLNSLLFHLEETLSQVCGDSNCSKRFAAAAKSRAAAVDKYLWCTEGFYCDFDIGWNRTISEAPNAAMMFPLFVKMASETRGLLTAKTLEQKLLKLGGVVTTLVQTGQQWDAPMGWAPLQWVAVQGLSNYNQDAVAEEVAKRFLRTVEVVYQSTNRLVEKYNVVDDIVGGGGEYPLADGFGWTNGVTMALLSKYGNVKK
jgi:alpha,alpha-trehalase